MSVYNDSLTEIFKQYPKQRSVLPKEYELIHKKHLMENRSGATKASWLVAKMEAWMHHKVAADVQLPRQDLSTLELGAGTLNHLRYEPLSLLYDIVEPDAQYYRQSPMLKRVSASYQSIYEVPDKQVYDRIISIAVLEHLEDLPGVIAQCGLHLKPEGCLRAGIPNEGTPLWTLGYQLTTGIEFRKRYGLNYSLIMKHEHLNTADEIEEVLKFFFKKVNCRIFGIHKELGFYRFYDCSFVEYDRCRDYLKNRRH